MMSNKTSLILPVFKEFIILKLGDFRQIYVYISYQSKYLYSMRRELYNNEFFQNRLYFSLIYEREHKIAHGI